MIVLQEDDLELTYFLLSPDDKVFFCVILLYEHMLIMWKVI